MFNKKGLNSNKRYLSSDDDDESPSAKKRRYNEVTESLIANISKIVEDDTASDVTFIVGINNDIQHIHGIKALFAAQSDVFKNMLYGNMSESISKQIVINDVTKEAFEYIKEMVHFSAPSLEFDHVIDILYIAQKYMISSIVNQCKQKILSMDDVDTFYLMMNSIGKYAPSTFESILHDIMEYDFVIDSVDDIIAESDKFNSLKIFEAKLLIKLISNEFNKYKISKSFCQSYVDKDDLWKNCFLLHFFDCIDVTKLSLDELMNDIRSDGVISEFQLLDLVNVKIKELQSSWNKLHEKKNNVIKENEKLILQNSTLMMENTKLNQAKKITPSKYNYSGWSYQS